MTNNTTGNTIANEPGREMSAANLAAINALLPTPSNVKRVQRTVTKRPTVERSESEKELSRVAALARAAEREQQQEALLDVALTLLPALPKVTGHVVLTLLEGKKKPRHPLDAGAMFPLRV